MVESSQAQTTAYVPYSKIFDARGHPWLMCKVHIAHVFQCDREISGVVVILQAPGGEECDNDLFACDDNESPINASSWKVFFEASSTSKYMRLQPFPEDAW